MSQIAYHFLKSDADAAAIDWQRKVLQCVMNGD